jgi:hypothetical protein
MSVPSFTKHVVATVVNTHGPGEMNTLGIVGDVNGDGRPDIVICGRIGRMVWIENPGRIDGEWAVHPIGEYSRIECGGSFFDLDHDGNLDFVNGSDSGHDEMYWWQNPGASGRAWMRHTILKTGNGMTR